jgi:hypothetical protein
MKLQELSNPQIVTLAVYQLGGGVTPVEVEDIAVRSSELAGKRFSWRKYPEQIDLRIVQYSLRDACKEDLGLLQGSSKFGYMLTGTGLDWASSLKRIDQGVMSPRKASPDDLINRERFRLENTRAFTKYVSGRAPEIVLADFREFTRVNDYFPEHLKKQRYTKIENAIRGNKRLQDVWDYLIESFKEELL